MQGEVIANRVAAKLSSDAEWIVCRVEGDQVETLEIAMPALAFASMVRGLAPALTQFEALGPTAALSCGQPRASQDSVGVMNEAGREVAAGTDRADAVSVHLGEHSLLRNAERVAESLFLGYVSHGEGPVATGVRRSGKSFGSVVIQQGET